MYSILFFKNDRNMKVDMLELRERVTVSAVFAGGKMRPVWFVWRGRKYQVAEVTYEWGSRDGMAVIMHFSVACGANVYNLAYNPVNLAWELRGVEQDWRG